MHAGIESKQSVWSQWTEATIRKVFMVLYWAPGFSGVLFLARQNRTGRRFANQPATDRFELRRRLRRRAVLRPGIRYLRASQKSPRSAISARGRADDPALARPCFPPQHVLHEALAAGHLVEALLIGRNAPYFVVGQRRRPGSARLFPSRRFDRLRPESARRHARRFRRFRARSRPRNCAGPIPVARSTSAGSG